MKLHLPLSLRRAVYHTFIAGLAGLAAAASTAMAATHDDITYKVYPTKTTKGALVGIFIANYEISNELNSGNYILACSEEVAQAKIKAVFNETEDISPELTEFS